MGPDKNETFRLTVFTGKSQLTKTIKLKDGKLNKLPPQNAGSGSVKTISIRLRELLDVIDSFKKSQCLIHGDCGYDEIGISPRFFPKENTIHRTKDYFAYKAGKPSLAMFDHDPDGVGQYYSPAELVDVMSEILPGFRSTAHVVKPSTSAEIYDVDGNRLSPKEYGYHCYFVAVDGSDLPRFKDVLFKRLWLTGYGHCRLSKSGAFLVRTVFDKSVLSPERCDFVSGAVLGKGLEQRLQKATYTEGGLLDTAMLEDLSAPEEARFQTLVAAKREELKPEQKTVRQKYVKAEAKRTGETPEKIAKRLDNADNGVIAAETVLKTKQGDSMSIAQMVIDGRNGEYVEDPTETSDTWARLYINGERQAVLRSFLHGGASFTVVWDDEPPTFDQCIDAATGLNTGSTPDEINEVLELATTQNPNAIQKRAILSAIKSSTGTPMGDLKRAYNEIRQRRAGPSSDLGYKIAKQTLARFYANGKHLVRAQDKRFWFFNGKHWEPQTDEQIQSHVLQVVVAIVQSEFESFAAMTRAAMSLLVAMQAAHGDVLRLSAEPLPIINCQNGELWILPDDTVELRPHDHASYLTYVLNVAYDTEATCPRFDQGLVDTFANSSDPTDMVRHITEFMGYAIQPRRNIPAWFMLRGKGRNGKTKLMETLEHLVNKRAIHSGRLAEIEKNRFTIGSLPGKLLVVDDDVDTGTKLPDGLLKKISERKLMTGEHKFKDSFEFTATCLPVVLANNLPITADLSYGLRRRAHLIPFDRVFTDDDADDKLFPYIWEHELPGVLNRCIEGLMRLQGRGKFLQPLDCIELQKTWLAQANPLTAFIDERCHKSVGNKVSMETFYSNFESWADKIGLRKVPSQLTVKPNLENLGYAVPHTNKGNVIYGLDLLDAPM
jgi:P4 family phage/plasmid primase-like protien